MESRNLIEGICLDDRIGGHYNNPSFGYGGYCLPKDTKQLLSSFNGTPQSLISAIINSNDTRKKYIASEILKSNPNIVGIYRLNMKFGSNNFRHSAIIDIIQILLVNDINVIIYEPSINDLSFMNAPLEKSLEVFKDSSSIILANRITDDLLGVEDKIFSRDLFHEN
jgi:UDPglucose 6-dehydrogenase